MPSGDVHRYFTRKVLGKSYAEVHRIMDSAHKVLGPKHRVVGHDLLTVAMFTAKNPKYGLAALTHLALDFAPPKVKRLVVALSAIDRLNR